MTTVITERTANAWNLFPVRIIFDDFSGGEYGHPGGANAPENSFTSRNMVVYRSGLIGPRAGIKAYSVTPAASAISNLFRAVQDGAAVASDLWWVTTAGAVVKAVEATGAKTTLTGSIVAPSRAVQSAHLGGGKYMLSNFGDKSYLVNLVANTVTAIAGSPGGSTIAMYGDRVYVGNDGFTPGYNRVYYTDPAVFTTFPVANFFDIGSRPGVAALIGQKDHLAIAMEDGSWHVFRGAGSAASLRKVTAADWPNWGLNPHAVCLLADDIIQEMTPLGDWPATFDGTNLTHAYRVGPNGDSVPYSDVNGIRILPGRRPQESLIVLPDGTNGARGYLNRDGVWTIHTFPTNISSVATTVGSTGRFVLCDKTASTAFYDCDLDLDRPAFTSDAHARPGDLSSTPVSASLTLPEFWSQPNIEIRVRQVIVDFVKYATGATSPSTNNITLGITAFGMFSDDGTESPAAQSWTEENALANTTGVQDRVAFNVGEQGFGSGFQATLSAIRGVAIKSITVVLDAQPTVPRY